MDIKTIRELAVLMREEGLEALTLERDDETISLKRPRAGRTPSAAPAPAAIGDAPIAAAEATVQEAGTVTVSSPMVGVYYAAATPDAAPFVTQGQTVAKGDVLCIIEAMKLMNEIVAEEAGIVTKCYQTNGKLVEFGQPLFEIRGDA